MENLIPRPIAASAIFFCALLVLAGVAPVRALTYQAGVNAGDSTFYTVGGIHNGGATFAHASVISVVQQVNVTESFTYYYPGSSSQSKIYWIDVSTGNRWNQSSSLFFAISSGLQNKDPLFSGSKLNMTGPFASPCGGVSRQVVYLQYFENSASPQVILAHWDRATGILCDYQTSDFSGTTNLSLIMSNTTLWSNSATDAFTTAAEVTSILGVPLLVLIVFVFFRKRRRSRPRKTV